MRIARVSTLVLVGLGLGCGSGAAPVADPASAASASPAAPAAAQATPATPGPSATGAVDCDDTCTTYAVCYENHYKRDYHGGSGCVSGCEDMTPADRADWAKKVTAASAEDGCPSLFTD